MGERAVLQLGDDLLHDRVVAVGGLGRQHRLGRVGEDRVVTPGPSLSGCVETPRSPGVTREGVTGDSLVSSNSPGLPGAGDHLAAGSIEAVPDPAARPVRRSFTAAYRARVVAEYEAAPRGSKAAVLRREGLYQSQIREWTIARDALTRGAAAPRVSASRAIVHSRIWDWYKPSRRSTAALLPRGAASYSATTRARYAAVNERRTGRAAGSGTASIEPAAR